MSFSASVQSPQIWSLCWTKTSYFGIIVCQDDLSWNIFSKGTWYSWLFNWHNQKLTAKLDNMKMSWQEVAGDAKFIVIEYRCFFLYQIICLVLICLVIYCPTMSNQENWKKTTHFRLCPKHSHKFPLNIHSFERFLVCFFNCSTNYISQVGLRIIVNQAQN